MPEGHFQLTRGARLQPDGRVCFNVWAPAVRQLAVRCGSPTQTISMQRQAHGLYTAAVTNVAAGDHYAYLLDGERLRPDPVSRFQPLGVHGPSAVVDPQAFAWTDASWRGIGLRDVLLYELHVGTFSAAGTFPALIPHLGYLKNELGVTAIELM